MSHNYTKLVAQGRAKSFGTPWSEHELEALTLLETERKLQRTVAADFIRNGVIATKVETRKNGKGEDVEVEVLDSEKVLALYDKLSDSDFKPVTQEEIEKRVTQELAQETEKAIKDAEKKEGVKEEETPPLKPLAYAPVDRNEIKEKLKEKGIEYDGRASTDSLLQLLEDSEKEDDVKVVPETEEEEKNE